MGQLQLPLSSAEPSSFSVSCNSSLNVPFNAGRSTDSEDSDGINSRRRTYLPFFPHHDDDGPLVEGSGRASSTLTKQVDCTHMPKFSSGAAPLNPARCAPSATNREKFGEKGRALKKVILLARSPAHHHGNACTPVL